MKNRSLNRTIIVPLSILIASLFSIGCGDGLPETATVQPETATVQVEILSSPNPLTTVEPAVENNPNGPVCKTGDILGPGQSCFYPGTDTAFSVLNNGNAHFLYATVGTGITMLGTLFNDQRYTFVASKRDDGFWEIKEVGESSGGELTLSVTTYTKQTFAITQDFDQDFQLDPDDWRISVALFNGTSYTLSIRITLLLDGEVEFGEEELMTPGTSISRTRTRTRY